MTNQTKPAAGVQTDVLLRAQAVMNIFVQNYRTKQQLVESIATQKKICEEQMKIAEKELIEIGKLNPQLFDKDGNIDLGDGYIHTATHGVVKVSRKFDAKEFAKEFPEMFDLADAFKIKPLQKGFLDADVRKELKGHGISLTTEKDLEVKVRESTAKLPTT